MATRFYLPSSTGGPAAPVSPAFDAGWELTTGGDRVGCRVTKGTTTTETVGPRAKTVATNPANVLTRQYVSVDTIPDSRTISGTVSAAMRAYESSSSANVYLQMVIKVVAADGVTVRGTLHPGLTTPIVSGTGLQNDEFATVPQQQDWLSVSLSPVAAQAGDHIVIELGGRYHTAATTYTHYLYLGSEQSTTGLEYAPSEGSTTNNTPWVEFSAELFGTADPDVDVPLDTAATVVSAWDVAVSSGAVVPLGAAVCPVAAWDVVPTASGVPVDVTLDAAAVSLSAWDVTPEFTVVEAPIVGISDILIDCPGLVDYDPPVTNPEDLVPDVDYDPATVAPPSRLQRVPDYIIHTGRANA